MSCLLKLRLWRIKLTFWIEATYLGDFRQVPFFLIWPLFPHMYSGHCSYASFLAFLLGWVLCWHLGDQHRARMEWVLRPVGSCPSSEDLQILGNYASQKLSVGKGF